MKKLSFKKLLLAVLSLVMVLTLASCGTKEFESALASYLLPEDGTTVEGDFVLDSSLTVGEVKYDLTWSSSNEQAIAINANKDEAGNVTSYTAKVELQDQITDVTLTLGIGKEGKMSKVSKAFHVNVAALTVYSFSSAYSFPKDKATVTEDFDLSQTFTVQGKTATISWSVDEEYQSYIKISEDGTKCLVTGNDLMPQVHIKATFTYNGESTTKSYRMVASRAKTQAENVDDWYYTMGTSIDFKGYVVEIATAYSAQYGNVSFYAVDENNNAGYYVYRGKISSADAENLVKGAYVTVTACTSTLYNGLVESTAGCTVTVDPSKKDEAKAQAAYALDEDLFAGAPQALYAQSRMVSLTKWQVKKVEATALGKSSPTKVLTLEKEGKTVTVNVTKYFEGAYAFDPENEVIKAIMAKLATLADGDYVNVTGVLGNYNGEQIALLSADGLEKVEAEAEGTAHPGKLVAPLIAANQKALEDAKVVKGAKSLIVAAQKTVTLAASTDDVTIAYELMGASNNVALEGNVLTITPQDEEKVTVKITYTAGEYVSVDYFAIRSVSKTDQEKVDDELDAFLEEDRNGEVSANTTITYLPATGETFEDVQFTYTVEDEEQAKLVEISEGRLIYLLPVDENKEVVVKATLTLNEATASTTFTITIVPESFTKYTVVTAPEADGEYYLGLYHATVGKWMFINGELSGNYGASVQNYTEAKKVKLVVTDEATMSGKIQVLMGEGVVKYLNIVVTEDKKNNVAFGDDAETATVWKWNAEHSTGTTMGANDKEVYLGGYGTYTTFSFSVAADYLPKCDIDNATSFCIKFYQVEADNSTREERAQKSLDALRLEAKVEGDYTLPTEAAYDDVRLSYALKEAVEGQSIVDGVLKVTRGDADVSVVVVATAKVGDVVKTKEFTVVVAANAIVVNFEEAYAIAAALENKAATPVKYELTGVVVKLDKNNNAYIGDGTGRELEAYKVTTAKVGDIIKVTGVLKKYNSTLEFDQCKLEETIASEAAIQTPSEIDALYRAEGADTAELAKVVRVSYGYITKIESAWSAQYKNISIWMSDETGSIEAYRLTGAHAEGLKVGDFVTVYGKVKLYVPSDTTKPSVVEFDSGCKLLNVHEEAVDKVEALALNDENKKVMGVVERIGGTPYYVLSDGTGLIGLTFAEGFTLAEGNTYILSLGKLEKFSLPGDIEIDLLCTEATVVKSIKGDSKIAAPKTALDEVNKVGKYSIDGVGMAGGAAAGTAVSLSLVDTNFQALTLEGTYDISGFAVKVVETSAEGAENKTYAVVFVVIKAEPQQGKTPETAYTTAKALEMGADLAKTTTSAQGDVVEGYFAGVVVDQGTDKTTYTQNVKILDADAAEGAKSLLVYSVNNTEAASHPLKNDQVIIKGFLVNFNGTIEISSMTDASGNKVYPTLYSVVRGTSTISVASTSSAQAHVTLSAESGVNLSTFTFTVTVDEGHELLSVKVNGVAVEAVEGVYTGTVAGDTVVSVETKEAGAAEPELAASLSFANTEQRVSQDANSQVWSQNGITFTNAKASSTTAVANYSNPVRCYKNSTIEIAYTGIVKVVIHCATGKVMAATDPITEGGVSVVEGTDVTITFSSAVNSFVITCAAGQVQIKSIDVYTMPTA